MENQLVVNEIMKEDLYFKWLKRMTEKSKKIPEPYMRKCNYHGLTEFLLDYKRHGAEVQCIKCLNEFVEKIKNKEKKDVPQSK